MEAVLKWLAYHRDTQTRGRERERERERERGKETAATYNTIHY